MNADFLLENEVNRWLSKTVITTEINWQQISMHKVFTIFATDYLRYYPEHTEIKLASILDRAELQGILCYRIAREMFLQQSPFCNQLSLLGRYLSGFEIYYSAEIDEGLKINHGLGTVIGARSKIGKNALIHQNVTLGDKNNGRPILLDNVTIYAGAKILGNITIGNNASIGANAVCMKDVPDNVTAVGVPAKIL